MKILAAGGSLERAENGSPIGLDLASERVFADDELVRTTLEFPHLKRLRMAVSKASPETLAELARLSELEELFLQDAPLDDAALTALLHALPELQRMALRRLSRVTNAGLEALPDCRQLSVVALIEMSGITGAALQTLRNVQRLRLLDLRNCGQLTTADFAQLLALSSLQELKLGGPAINDDVLVLVAQHPSLSALSLEDAQVSSTCLQRLAESRDMAGRLRSISLARCFGVTDESLHVLREFPQLESLTLREIMLTGSFLQYVHDAGDERLPLKTLVITDAFLTDEALAPLPALFSTLIRLDLSGNQGLTDAGTWRLETGPHIGRSSAGQDSCHGEVVSQWRLGRQRKKLSVCQFVRRRRGTAQSRRVPTHDMSSRMTCHQHATRYLSSVRQETAGRRQPAGDSRQNIEHRTLNIQRRRGDRTSNVEQRTSNNERRPTTNDQRTNHAHNHATRVRKTGCGGRGGRRGNRLGRALILSQEARGANDRIGVGFIGTGGRCGAAHWHRESVQGAGDRRAGGGVRCVSTALGGCFAGDGRREDVHGARGAVGGPACGCGVYCQSRSTARAADDGRAEGGQGCVL